MDGWSMIEFDWGDRPAVDALPLPALWRNLDGGTGRAYRRQAGPPPAGWTALTALRELAGASAGIPPTHHYAVEADVLPEHEDDFNAWYEQEHLPGLAAVPGTVAARRFVRSHGSPRYIACYDLTAPETLQSAPWLAVRATEWSSRVRPFFRGTRRAMFVRADLWGPEPGA